MRPVVTWCLRLFVSLFLHSPIWFGSHVTFAKMGKKWWKKAGKSLVKGITQPVKIVSGATATAINSVAYAATFGQNKAVNRSLKKCAKFTGKAFMDSDIRHLGEATGRAVAGIGCAAADAALLGQSKAVRKGKLDHIKQLKVASLAPIPQR